MNTPLLNNPVDISNDYQNFANEYYIPASIKSFDSKSASGTVEWQLHRYMMDWYFNKIDKHLALQSENAASFQSYDVHPVCEFSLSFISSRTFRLKMKTTTGPHAPEPSLMIDDATIKTVRWNTEEKNDEIIYFSDAGKVAINTKNFSIKILNNQDKVLTSTLTRQHVSAMHSKSVPFSFVRKAGDYSRNIAASFTSVSDEKIFGCGESFTSLNKHGQKVVIFSSDAQSTASPQMYKPIPFFFSNRGYGMFVHTPAPVTLDFGHSHYGTNTVYSGDDFLDIFFFLGTPGQILEEYTSLTGRSPLPPLWSFGLWMGCFSYTSEKEVRDVATKMRKLKFPCDVIHIDSGWFENGINCDFQFNKTTFPNPDKMISDLKNEGFRISLWQLPYFTPHNPVFQEVTEKQLYIKDGNGNIPTEDAILDFTNEEAIKWYSEKISRLLRMGVSAIKVDFGEAAPVNGYYASGKSGWYEHNLYPLRYNKIVSDLTQKIHNERIIWARSACAGSQRYPIHWGGDAEVSDAGMAGSLRGGLSLGLSGFSFWSHDIGGFSGSPVEELFARWSFFGLMSSHSRVHGFPPREPWHYSAEFQSLFRNISSLRYRLLPYIYTQAAIACNNGLPLMKALLLNYPEDPVTWTIDDQYLLGNDILIAPLFEEKATERMVYLPQGKWVSHHTRKVFEGQKWYRIEAGELMGIIMYRWGSLIPVTPLIESTALMNWKRINLVAFTDDAKNTEGILLTPDLDRPIKTKVSEDGTGWMWLSPDRKEKLETIDYRTF